MQHPTSKPAATGKADTSAKAERFLRLPEVMSRSGIYAAIQRGEFPHSIPLGGQSVAWLEPEITAWQDARIAQRQYGACTAG